MSVRRVATEAGGSLGPSGGRVGPAPRTSCGACQRPRAIAAATFASASGLTSMRPWPKAAAASSTGLVGTGTAPVKAGWPSFRLRPMPSERAAAGSVLPATRGARLAKAVLQEWTKSWAKLVGPSASCSALRKRLPLTVIWRGQSTRVVRLQAVLEQGEGGHDLEGRAGRVLAQERDVVAARVGSDRDGDDGAAADPDRDQGAWLLHTGEGGIRCLLRPELERRPQRPAEMGDAPIQGQAAGLAAG